MNNFIYHNPTKLVFGKGQIARLPKLIPAGKRIMLTFGGGSVKRNGVYDQVVAALEGRDLVEFWGIEPNPSIETLREAIALGKEREVDFLLAVGGGRPLSSSLDALRQMEAQRRPLYLAAADAVIPNNGTLDDALHAAMEALDEIFDS